MQHQQVKVGEIYFSALGNVVFIVGIMKRPGGDDFMIPTQDFYEDTRGRIYTIHGTYVLKNGEPESSRDNLVSRANDETAEKLKKLFESTTV